MIDVIMDWYAQDAQEYLDTPWSATLVRSFVFDGYWQLLHMTSSPLSFVFSHTLIKTACFT
jgi:hypothetical protein